MKKFILSGLVIVAFVGYIFVSRHNSHTVIPPSGSMPANGSSGSNSSVGSSGSSTSSQSAPSSYKDGTYTGSVSDAFYGNVQVQVAIKSGKISSINFLQYPSQHPTSQSINQQAIPYLKQETIQAQSSNVNIITGATYTSQAYIQSLASALSQA
jgi:uncharacterized protein with FMN-binding domain